MSIRKANDCSIKRALAKRDSRTPSVSDALRAILTAIEEGEPFDCFDSSCDCEGNDYAKQLYSDAYQALKFVRRA